MINNNQTIKYTIDATGKALGRVSTEIASIILGKNTTTAARNSVVDADIEVVNASKIKISGDKFKTSVHKRYTGFPSGLRLPTLTEIASKKGYKELVRHAVEGMLPKNKLQKLRMQKLNIKD
jgi:large subunit ribosomal protein L13